MVIGNVTRCIGEETDCCGYCNS